MTSIRDLVEARLALAGTKDSALHALISTLDEQALRDADRLDEATGPRGSLHGLPVTLKDNIDVAGVVSTAGSAHHSSAPAVTDATATRLLREAGAVVVAKNNMAEFAMGVVGRNDTFGDCRNAWDHARISGGSSSGSAVAVAAGMCAASLGTDTGGSGRVPAAVNGIVGVRPTLGRVSNAGVFPVSSSFDVVSPMAVDVRTAAAVLAALDEWDPADPTSVNAERIPVESALAGAAGELRVGVPANTFFDDVEPGVASVLRSALDALREVWGEPRRVAVPDVEIAQRQMLDMMYPEAAEVHEERVRLRPETLDPDVLRRIRLGHEVPPRRAQEARRWRGGFQRRVDDVFAEVDVIATPTIPVDVPRRDAVDLADSTRSIARFTYVWSMYGGPSISVPCGRHPDSGMPVGIQLTAARWQDHLALRAALAVEEVSNFAGGAAT
ncbi:amidase [Saccharopolyspora sp. NFXS83]|uniref:amidase n=1 Tax=Saccharopolyspora sp. NFXS83 TaxID=2993560 RepID=UPI00224B3A59|nr:amidase [Saccharopolyspora sp. NFXS83]MCX2729579.1 amidase [Saccharopolyspora sp. NFXS83]